jgi:hypothetical protein
MAHSAIIGLTKRRFFGMMRSRKFANPFYGLLLVAGIAFALTATTYGVMAFRNREARPVVASASYDEHALMAWMRRHGEAALMTELAFLAVGTFGAIATDDYWQRRTNREEKRANG